MPLLGNILQLAALILSLVNGAALFYQYLRDRPALKVKPIHPDAYQWWFRLPRPTSEPGAPRRYGLLAHVGIENRGLRKVQMNSWRLPIRTKAGARINLIARSIPEPKFVTPLPDGSAFTKVIQVLGTAGQFGTGSTVIDSGCSTIGVAYYVLSFPSGSSDDLRVEGETATGDFIVTGVYGRPASAKMRFHEVDFERVRSAIDGIEVVS